jgi:hypothetical protein
MPTQLVGSDGKVPVYDPSGRFQIWALPDVWDGTTGDGKYVPRVNDLVVDPASLRFWRVEALTPVSLIPVLTPVSPPTSTTVVPDNDILFGVDQTDRIDVYKAYINKQVTPWQLCIDPRYFIPGSDSLYAKIFSSNRFDSSGTVISQVFDNNGTLLSDTVTLQNAIFDNRTNINTKTVPTCNTSANLQNNDLVTLVVYNNSGSVVHKRQFQVIETTFVRPLNSATTYITHVSLETSLLSKTVPNLLEVPINVDLNDFAMTGVVHYSDGSTQRYLVDGGRFSLQGKDQIYTLIAGSTLHVNLVYRLQQNEVGFNTSLDGTSIVNQYSVRLTDPNRSIGVKLFMYPEWNSTNGYSLRYWMLNLDRNLYMDVTPYISLDSAMGSFNPFGYGVLQTKTVNLNLKNISNAFPDFIHRQTFNVELFGQPGSSTTDWVVKNEDVSSRASYGVGLKATQSTNTINVASNATDITDWLNKVYRQTYPILDPVSEVTPPTPTHFAVMVNGLDAELPISSWNQPINLGFDTSSLLNKVVYIRFFRRIGSVDSHLSIAGLLVK